MEKRRCAEPSSVCQGGGGCCSTVFPLTKHGAICFEESHGRRWRRFGTFAEISKK